ncbi:MAG: glucose-6-phosphate isomerase, partial [Bacteroidota bacterium]
MLPRINPTSTKAWQALQQHAAGMKELHMRDLFSQDPERFKKFSLCLDEMVFDYSKNIITDKTIQLLLQLASECKLKDGVAAMFNGDIINETEQRAVLHTALRNFSGEPVFSEGTDVMPGIKKVLRKMKSFCQAVHSGKFRGYTNKRIKYIINIGIGGSDLGPLMVTEALKPYRIDGIETYFVSNVDGTHIAETLKK